MAALTMTPPTRQPFASLDTPRMRPIMRARMNRQNQHLGASKSAQSAKTSSCFIIEDAENIAPQSHSQAGKRKRTLEDEDGTSTGSPKPLKSSRLALSICDMNFSPRLSTPIKLPLSTPKSAPIVKPAGRSPPPKSSLSARRSTIGKSRPESTRRAGVARPFSLAKALSHGKIKSPAPPQPKGPSSWFFDIHVDSEQEEMTNLMQHSTGVLDISDDESKVTPVDDRGKENVPPAELGIELAPAGGVVSPAAETRNVAKMEQDRAPLGELNAADYYPEGCNAFSVAIVHDDDGESLVTAPTKSSPLSQSVIISSAATDPITSDLVTDLAKGKDGDEEDGPSTDAADAGRE